MQSKDKLAQWVSMGAITLRLIRLADSGSILTELTDIYVLPMS